MEKCLKLLVKPLLHSVFYWSHESQSCKWNNLQNALCKSSPTYGHIRKAFWRKKHIWKAVELLLLFFEALRFPDLSGKVFSITFKFS